MKQTRTGSSKQKTARFDALVQSSGQPETVTLWTKPEDDKAFMRAVREHRVLTLVQGNVGSRKDFGLVGFTKQKNASYLVFPNRLAFPAETKVVGIKYERLAATHPKGPVFKPARRRKPGIPMREQSRFTLEDEDRSPEKRSLKQSTNKSKAPLTNASQTERRKPAQKTFRTEVTITAIQKVTLTTEATSSSEAQKELRALAENLSFNPTQATITRKIGQVKNER